MHDLRNLKKSGYEILTFAKSSKDEYGTKFKTLLQVAQMKFEFSEIASYCIL